MTLEAKYRLHATKVDRIAVVDRPAVPDAKVVLFKRKKDTGTDVLKKGMDFNREFVYKATQSAVDVLEQSFWNTLYYQEEGVDTEKEWKKLFKDFRSILIDVVAKLTPSEKKEDDGRWKMAESLRKQHPDVVDIVWKWDRWQHSVNYKPFAKNKLIKKPGVVIPKGVNNYGMKLIKV